MRRVFIAMVLGAAPVFAWGQHFGDPNSDVLRTEEARRLEADGHYYAARLLLKEDATAAERLVCDYYLNEPGAAERIAQWTEEHTVAPERSRLRLMRANLLVREGRYDDALAVYAAEDVDAAPEDEATEARLYQAIACLNTGLTANARNILASIEGRETHQADVMFYSGYARYADGDYAEALPYFRAVDESYDYGRKAPVYEADCYLNTGRPAEALQLVRAARSGRGVGELSDEALRIEGEALYDQGQTADAVAALQQYASATSSPQRKALYKLGMGCFQQKNYVKAASALSQSAGSARDAMAQNAWLHSGIAYVNTNNKQQARMAFQQAAEMDGDPQVQEEALYNYALALHDGATMGFGESVGVFEQFLNKFPQSQYRQSVAQHLEEVYFTTKNYPAALASINKIKNPSSEIVAAKQKVLYNLGVQKFTDGDFAAAKQYMQQSLQTKANAESYYWKGESEYRLGEYAAAAKDLQSYLGAGSGNAKNRALAQYALGYTRFKQRNLQAALPSFQQFASTDAATLVGIGGWKALKADALNRIGDCQFAARNYDAAYASYEEARQTDASGGDYSLLQQSLISGLRGNYQQKVDLLNQLGASYQNSQYGADALFEQGRAYVQSGAKQQAMDTFSALVQKYPESANARKAGNEIGMIYFENGQTDAAISAYKQVIQKYPNTAEARTALANLKDVYTEQGRVDEYAALAKQVGQSLTDEELDKMTEDAAIRAVSSGSHQQALAYYQRLEAQTQSAETRQRALEGQLRAASALGDCQATADVAGRLLQDGSKASPEVQAEARLLRAKCLMAQGQTDAAVADYQILRQDTRTAYGAQGTVELAQYAYDTQQYQSAEDLLTEFTESGTPHAYWLARAFVLLADVYAQTDRKIEAQQYLLSLKSNYTESEEINQMIADRLAKLQ